MRYVYLEVSWIALYVILADTMTDFGEVQQALVIRGDSIESFRMQQEDFSDRLARYQ